MLKLELETKFIPLTKTLMLKELRQDKTFRVYCWQAFASLVVVWLTALASFDDTVKEVMLVLGIPAVSALFKYINTKYLWDAGVETDPVIEDLQHMLKEARKSLNEKK